MKNVRFVMVFLVLLLMVVVVACAKKDIQQQAEVEQDTQIEEPVQPEPEPEPEPIAEPQTNEDEEANLAALNLFINEHIYFDFDSAVLRPDSQESLQSKVQVLQDNPQIDQVVIEGHCDERGTNAYNMALGSKRAEAVKQYFVDLGISPQKLQTLSFGEERPIDAGQSEEAWSKNRRASFVIN